MVARTWCPAPSGLLHLDGPVQGPFQGGTTAGYYVFIAVCATTAFLADCRRRTLARVPRERADIAPTR